jgi:hypothetical protein
MHGDCDGLAPAPENRHAKTPARLKLVLYLYIWILALRLKEWVASLGMIM